MDDNVIPLHRLRSGQVEVVESANGRISSARLSNRYLAEAMFDARIISESQLRCGYQFLDMKRAFTAQSSYARMMRIIEEVFTHEAKPYQLEVFYKAVCKAIGWRLERTITEGMEQLAPHLPNGKRLSDYLPTDTPDAFFKLEYAFIRIKKLLDDPDDPR